MEITAYSIFYLPPMTIEPAGLKRDWAEPVKSLSPARHPGFARGSQAGWVILSPLDFSFTWNGELKPFEGLTFTSKDPAKATYGEMFSNAFGHGILTVSIPFVFRTSPGYGLMVRGPANFAVDNLQPLDGLVETDWLESTFTMNWRILKPHVTTGFKKGDPLCMIQPYPLALLEATEPTMLPADDLVTLPPLEGQEGGTWRLGLADPAPQLGKARLRLGKFQ